jgi:divinyl protochlorophyllide a 8-vinyl-reductase
VNAGAGRIGPNAVTRLAEALVAQHGQATCADIFRSCGLEHHLAAPPTDMVPDADVARLHLAMRAMLGPSRAAAVSEEAGRLTAAYLLEHRIPRVAQRLLAQLPPLLALRLLLPAIAAHAWTFAGAGAFSYSLKPLVLSLHGAPVSRLITSDTPVCQYYAATFAGLFSALLRRPVRVRESACQARGDRTCLFDVRW